MCRDYFAIYDVDKSGTLDTAELKKMTSAVLFKLKMRVPAKKLKEQLVALQEGYGASVNGDQYTEWFGATFMQ